MATVDDQVQDLRHHKVMLSGVDLHYVTAGDEESEPLVLIHGFPRSWFEWREVIPRLAGHFRIIAPDLRGSGDSSKPYGGFDKKTMSGDIVELLDQLGLDEVHVVGRDWGAPVALALALHWRRARTLTFIENLVPGFGFEEAIIPIPPTSVDDDVLFQWGGVNHATFHLIPDVAEFLIQGREREYFNWFLKRLAYNTGAVDQTVLDECVRCMSAPGALRATLGYTRACYQDGADNRSEVAKGKLQIPVLALGADSGAGDRVRTSLMQVATDLEADIVPHCGHWVADEQPVWLADRIRTFLSAHHAS